MTCKTNYIFDLNAMCISDSTTAFSAASASANTQANCLRFANGVDGYTKNPQKCLKCVNFSYQLKDGSCSQLITNPYTYIDYTTGAASNNAGTFAS